MSLCVGRGTHLPPDFLPFRSENALVNEFNKSVAMMKSIKDGGIEVTPFLMRIQEIAGGNINITRLSLESSGTVVVLNGTAPDQNGAVEFKNRIAGEPQFYEVYLPLSNVLVSGENVSFTITFKVLSLEFSEDVPEEVDEPEVQLPVDDMNEEVVQPQNDKDLGGELQAISEELTSADSSVVEPSIIFGKIDFISNDEPVYLDVSAVNSETAFLFRDLLEGSSAFHAVKIISELIDSANRVNFTIRFLIGP